MKSIVFLFVFAVYSYSQNSQFYTNNKGDLHLCGEFSIEELEENITFKLGLIKAIQILNCLMANKNGQRT